MKYFKNIKDLSELKKRYKHLALQLHPDVGGNEEDMQLLNAEFEQLFNVFKVINKNVKAEKKPETFIKHFYTENGWEGSNYSPYLSTTDIAKIIRDGVKLMYPLCKFSVRARDVNSINVYLMEANFNPFAEHCREYYQVNQYNIRRDNNLCDQAKQLFEDINALVLSYNYDDSNCQIDYFNTNFYYHLQIGKWDKPFKIVEKTARLGQKPNVTDKKIIIKEENK